ncbi:MAG: helix-turn-helix transcriptional regulator [Candidatus Eremiobacteraeota bacterium]|nr:helix-turn-helix transcriptional regulator [Candidatus Eremiobacteraeota bacterium]MCW5869744.1 helix-turn-helix transcriptional regulator [Candidatus Eremiobacteraeota bacterium]
MSWGPATPAREQWSRQDLADKLGVHRVTLARRELGEAEPPVELAEKLADVFQVDRHFFFQVAPFQTLKAGGCSRNYRPWLSRFPLAKSCRSLPGRRSRCWASICANWLASFQISRSIAFKSY